MNKPRVSAGVVAGVALGAAALGAAAVAVRAACLQVARTRNGLARVKRVHDEGGDEVRVLVQGGVYQSASYVGERWAEPVFAYYRAFDDVFEAEDAMRDAYGHGIDRMLMLGGGGFAYPKFALMSHESLRMDVVECDQGERRDVPARLRRHGTRGIRPRLGGPMWRYRVRQRGELPAHRQRRRLCLCRSRAF